MAFDEVQFPVDIGEKALGGPFFTTVVVVTGSGAEQRVGTQSSARLEWQLSPGSLDESDALAVAMFFRARMGRLRGFRFRDWMDYQATQEALTNPYPLAAMQLVKTYSSGGVSEVRNIKKPIASTVIMERNTGGGWAAWSSGGNWSLDATTGVVTVTTPTAGHLYRWTGEFDVPVRFDSDKLKFSFEGGIWTGESLPIIEVLL